MPGLNQTGPMGQGSMTGRRMGNCTTANTIPKNQTAESTKSANENMPENFQDRGFGFGRGRGRGRRGFGMGQQNRFRGGF